jgi:CheY-like chemotaxis protein
MTTESQFAEMPPNDAQRKQPEAMEKKTRPKRVLVVDDDPSVADTLTAILRNTGYEAVAAYDGLSGLSQCEDFRPEVVISDLFMPGMNGVELAMVSNYPPESRGNSHFIRQLYPACRVMLFSGREASAIDLIEQARQDGYAFELWEKPVHPKELLAKLAA